MNHIEAWNSWINVNTSCYHRHMLFLFCYFSTKETSIVIPAKPCYCRYFNLKYFGSAINTSCEVSTLASRNCKKISIHWHISLRQTPLLVNMPCIRLRQGVLVLRCKHNKLDIVRQLSNVALRNLSLWCYWYIVGSALLK